MSNGKRGRPPKIKDVGEDVAAPDDVKASVSPLASKEKGPVPLPAVLTPPAKPLTIKEHLHEACRLVENVLRIHPANNTLANGLSMLKQQVMPIIECGLREVGHKE